MMILFILIPFIVAHTLIIWLETDVFIEYIQLLRINKIISHFDKYLKQKQSPNYKEYLLKNHNNFFTRLITCYICFGTFLSGIIAILVGLMITWELGLLIWFPIAFLSLVLYKLFCKLVK